MTESSSLASVLGVQRRFPWEARQVRPQYIRGPCQGWGISTLDHAGMVHLYQYNSQSSCIFTTQLMAPLEVGTGGGSHWLFRKRTFHLDSSPVMYGDAANTHYDHSSNSTQHVFRNSTQHVLRVIHISQWIKRYTKAWLEPATNEGWWVFFSVMAPFSFVSPHLLGDTKIAGDDFTASSKPMSFLPPLTYYSRPCQCVRSPKCQIPGILVTHKTMSARSWEIIAITPVTPIRIGL